MMDRNQSDSDNNNDYYNCDVTKRNNTVDDDDNSPSVEKTHARQKKSRLVDKGDYDTAWSTLQFCLGYATAIIAATAFAFQNATQFQTNRYAASFFSSSPHVTTLGVLSGVFYTVVRPIIGKFSDEVGRAYSLGISVVAYVLGNAVTTVAGNWTTFVVGQILYNVGTAGLLNAIYIFFANTSFLRNRTLLNILPDVPYLWLWYVGPKVVAHYNMDINAENWRGLMVVWSIVSGIATIPFLLVLVFGRNQEMSAQSGVPLLKRLQRVVDDKVGTLSFLVFSTLFLLPFTLSENGWKAHLIALMAVGFAGLVGFFVYEAFRSKKGKDSFIPVAVFHSRTISCACYVSFINFVAFYLWDNYLYDFLIVTKCLSDEAAGHIQQTFSLSSTTTGILVGLYFKFVAPIHPRWITFKTSAFLGCSMYSVGLILQILFRTKTSSTAVIVLAQAAVGMGVGLFNMPLLTAVQSYAKPSELGVMSTIYLTAASFGAPVGQAVCGLLWEQILPRNLKTQLPWISDEERNNMFTSTLVAVADYPPGSLERDRFGISIAETIKIQMIVALVLSLSMIPAVWFCRSQQFEDKLNILSSEDVMSTQASETDVLVESLALNVTPESP